MIRLKSLLTEADTIKVNDTDISGKLITNKNYSADPWTYFISDAGVYYAQKNGGVWKDLKASLPADKYAEATGLINYWKDNKKAPDAAGADTDTTTTPPDSAANATSSGAKNTTLTMSDGSKWMGAVENGQPNGKGTMIYNDGSKYMGPVADGEPTGKGTLIWPDGDKYMGNFSYGLMHGKGTYAWPDGSKYVGDFIAGKFSGKGVKTTADGIKYVGEFKDDMFNGKGSLYYKHYVYTGTWKDNKYYSTDGKSKGLTVKQIKQLIDKIDTQY